MKSLQKAGRFQVRSTGPANLYTRCFNSTGFVSEESIFSDSPSSNEKSRHYLYAILREIRQLPAPAARQYIRSHALERFRSGRGASDERQKTRERRLKKELAYIKKANEGFKPHLSKLLMMTYGRTGRRRRDLLVPLLNKGETADDELDGDSPYELVERRFRETNKTDQDPILTSLPSIHPNNVEKVPTLTPILKALLRSQKRVVDPIMDRTHRIKSLASPIPEKNSWKRPMPQKRQISSARKHYKTLLQKTLPPLPADEWESLRRLALGIDKPTTQTAKHSGDTQEDPTLLGKDFSDLRDVLGDRQKLQKTLQHDKVEKAGGVTKPHHVTERFMRRLYAQVFELCPRLDWDGSVSPPQWNFTWGRQTLRQAERDDTKKMKNLARFL